jgi:hypothetical protein
MSQQTNLKTQLQQVDGFEFEQLIADVWAEKGWETQVLQASNDRGIDVVARREDPFAQKFLIQAKRYSNDNNVGSKEIQQYGSLRNQDEEADAVVVVTTSDFTNQAIDIGNELNVKMMNGDELVQFIHDADALEVVNKYLGDIEENPNGENNSAKQGQQRQTLDSDQLPNIYVKKLVDSAQGNLVTKNRISKLKSGMSHPQTPTENPILDYLYKDEVPHYTLRATKVRLPDQGVLKPENNAYLIPTNMRILILIGTESRDIDLSVPYRNVSDVGGNIGLTSKKIAFQTSEGTFRFKINHNHFNESQASDDEDITREVKACAQFIKEKVYSLL